MQMQYVAMPPVQTFHHTYHVILKCQAVPHSAIAGLMAVFRRLPQRVVIKLDSEYWREAAPANVMVITIIITTIIMIITATSIIII